ncbi:PREDICTED: bone morphogenetic protein 8B [Myotis davidii]|uniref:bone morphogenetic protein 8B n=1 Tax=Myotis davidii TaxID=225400 RepID=UPI000766ED67|nr:PREDICTED: bone morphogenetic protein 8B [Myotis davidii]
MVTFFRASPSPIRAPRAVRPLRRRLLKKTNELPQPNRLPGIFDGAHGSHGRQVCRRHELYVSFQDLGWLVHLMKPDAVPKACCAPTKLSATSVLYYDSSNNVILRKHRNMVVKACGCH